jgi:hypothetical protein
MNHRTKESMVLCQLLSLPLLLVACSTGPKTTVLTTSDLDATTADMAAKLAASKFLAERTAESPKVTIAISKVENLSSDIISEGEEWMLMEKVRDSLPIMQLGTQRNLVFVIAAEHLKAGQARGNLDADFAKNRKPTHEMDATFRSATRSRGKDRTDAYLVEYRITSLATGELVWDESFEFKRVATGLSYD